MSTVAAKAGPRSLAHTLSLANPRLFGIAVLASVVPLVLVQYLPMVDLPGHAALMTALREIAAGNEAFADAFATNWFTPYLLGYGLFYLLSLLMPVPLAAKLVVVTAIAMTPVMTAVLLREIGADERWRWLAIPASYSLAFYWGFLSFVVALPIGIALLALTVRFDREPTVRRGIIVASLAILLFFSHIIVMGFSCMCALAYVIGGRFRDLDALWRRCLPYTAPVPLFVAWFAITHATVEGVDDSPVIYGSVLQRIAYLISQSSGFDYVSIFGLIVTLTIVVLPFLCGSRWSSNPARWLPFAVGLAAFLIVPSYAFRAAFLYERLGVFLVPLWLMAFEPPTRTRLRLDFIAMLIVGLWVATNVWRFSAFARETQHFDAVVDAMEPGKKVASMIVDNTTPLFATPVYLHFPSWYQATRSGIVDFNFADFQMVVGRRDTSAPRIVEGLAWEPHRFDWRAHGGSSYDYFLVKANGDAAPIIFKDRIASVELIARSGWWWLYRNAE